MGCGVQLPVQRGLNNPPLYQFIIGGFILMVMTSKAGNVLIAVRANNKMRFSISGYFSHRF